MSAVPKQLTPWKPGQSGNPGGRQKRILPRVDEMLKQHGKEPIAELLKLLPQLHVRDQAKLWLEILPYVHAKVKPMELDTVKMLFERMREMPPAARDRVLRYVEALLGEEE